MNALRAIAFRCAHYNSVAHRLPPRIYDARSLNLHLHKIFDTKGGFTNMMSLFNAHRQKITPNIDTYSLMMKAALSRHGKAETADNMKRLRFAILLWRSIDREMLESTSEINRTKAVSMAIRALCEMDVALIQQSRIAIHNRHKPIVIVEQLAARAYREQFGDEGKLPLDEAIEIFTAIPRQDALSPITYGMMILSYCLHERLSDALKILSIAPKRQGVLLDRPATALITGLIKSSEFSDDLIVSIYRSLLEYANDIHRPVIAKAAISSALYNGRLSLASCMLQDCKDNELSISALSTIIGAKIAALRNEKDFADISRYLDRMFDSLTGDQRSRVISWTVPSFLSIINKSETLSPSIKKLEIVNGLRKIIDNDGEIQSKLYGVITEMYSRCGEHNMVKRLWNNRIMEPENHLTISNELHWLSDLGPEDRFVLQVLSDQNLLRRISPANREKTISNRMEPFLSIIIDHLGFQGDKITLDQLYNQVINGDLSAYIPCIDLNHHNSFIEAYSRQKQFDKAWQVFIDQVIPGVENGKFILEVKSMRPLLNFALSYDRPKFEIYNNFLKARWPHLAADVDEERLLCIFAQTTK